METWFYHLETRPIDAVLPALLEKTLAKGWRAFVRLADEGELARWDDLLWTYNEAGFLPHGRADRPEAERQPILLSVDERVTNRAEVVVVLGGAAPVAGPGVVRTLVLFSADDQPALTAARELWKNLRGQGASVTYWKEGSSGSWEKQA